MNWNPIFNAVLAGLWVFLGAIQEDLPELLADLHPAVLGLVLFGVRLLVGWIAGRLGKPIPMDTPVPGTDAARAAE